MGNGAFQQHPVINKTGPLDKDKESHIFWEGTQFAHTSHAVVNREFCSALIDSDAVELTIVPYEPEQFPPAGNPKFEKLQARDIRRKGFSLRDRKFRPHVWIRHQWPPRSTPPGKSRWIIMLPWEYSAVPAYYIDIINKAEQVWTPSQFSRHAYITSGIDPAKVHVVPNGVDTDTFSPLVKPLDLSAKRFTFLFVGATIYRKGIDILLESYGRAFTSRDDVCLVIKDLGVETHYKGQTSGDIIMQFCARKDAPEVLYLPGHFDDVEMARLYRTCDVFISSYRGEGFSLPTLEAMSCGLPVIVTRGGATDDFADEETGWLIDAEVKSIGKKVYGHPVPEDAFLLEPDRDHLTALLYDVYTAPHAIIEKGMHGALRARTGWTWRHAARKALSCIDSMCGTGLAEKAEGTFSRHECDMSTIRKAIEEKRHV